VHEVDAHLLHERDKYKTLSQTATTHLHDEVIAHLLHEGDEARSVVVEARVLPDEHEGVEDGLEQVHQGLEVVHGVEFVQELAQGLQEFDVVVGLLTCQLSLGEQPVRVCVCVCVCVCV